jgi:hypothetical protein
MCLTISVNGFATMCAQLGSLTFLLLTATKERLLLRQRGPPVQCSGLPDHMAWTGHLHIPVVSCQRSFCM